MTISVNDIPYFMTTYPVSINASGNSVSVKMSDGTVKSWGNNTSRQLGYVVNNNDETNFTAPLTSTYFKDITSYYVDDTVNRVNGDWVTSVENPYFSAINIDNVDYTYSAYYNFVFGTDGNVYETNVLNYEYLYYGGCVEYPTDYFTKRNALNLKVSSAKKICSFGIDNIMLMNNGTLMAWGSGIFNNFSYTGGWPAYLIDINNNGYTLVNNSSNYLDHYCLYHWLPNSVSGISGVNDVALYNGKYYLLMNDGSVNQLIFNSSTNTFSMQSTGITNAKSLYSADGALLTLKNDGTVTSYNGSTETVLNLQNIVQLAGSSNFAMALDSSGNIYSWGDNTYGELGQGNTTSLATPTQIPNIGNVKSIAARNISAYAIMNDNSIESWGDNTYGELGNGTTLQIDSPMPIPYFSYNATIPAVFPTEPISYTDYSSANDYWDSINGTTWQWS